MIFFLLLLGAQGHANMLKISINTEYTLAQLACQLRQSSYRATAQLLFMETLDAKEK